jgi:dolichyl-phosphate-mannose--protein O-mannosyl transferase
VANIYNIGNSVVLLFGLAAMAMVVARFAMRRTWQCGFLLAAYLMFWLPWLHSPRIMFFYTYMPSTAMLCVAGGWVLATWLRWWADGDNPGCDTVRRADVGCADRRLVCTRGEPVCMNSTCPPCQTREPFLLFGRQPAHVAWQVGAWTVLTLAAAWFVRIRRVPD